MVDNITIGHQNKVGKLMKKMFDFVDKSDFIEKNFYRLSTKSHFCPMVERIKNLLDLKANILFIFKYILNHPTVHNVFRQ
jgi:hypothetical protein